VDDDDSELEPGKILLIFEIAIDRDENVKPACGQPQQFAILYADPAGLRSWGRPASIVRSEQDYKI